jgi:hypothetical protein
MRLRRRRERSAQGFVAPPRRLFLTVGFIVVWSALMGLFDRYLAWLSNRAVERVIALSARHYPALPEELVPTDDIPLVDRRRRLFF